MATNSDDKTVDGAGAVTGKMAAGNVAPDADGAPAEGQVSTMGCPVLSVLPAGWLLLTPAGVQTSISCA